MYYVCIDNQEKRISSVLEYEPNVPAHVDVVTITDEEHKSIESQTHYFNIDSKSVVVIPSEQQILLDQEKIKLESIAFLYKSDWKVLRHIREKALGIETSLDDKEYIALEQQRADAASKL